jgi:hypothetical protein
MRGAFVDQGGLFSYISPEARVPAIAFDVSRRLHSATGSINRNQNSA